MKKIITILFFCLLSQGIVSASTFKLVPQKLDGQKSIKSQGVENVVSHKKASVLIRGTEDSYALTELPAFVLGVFCEKEVIISTENIKAFVDGKSHRILSPKEQAIKIKNDHEAKVSAVMLEYTARYDKVSHESLEKDINEVQMVIGPPEALSKQNNIPGIGSGNPFKDTVIDTVGMEEGQRQASDKLKMDLDLINRDTNEAIKRLKTIAFKKVKVPPKTWYLGEVTLDQITDPDSAHKIKIVVNVFGEDHEFLLKNNKIQ